MVANIALNLRDYGAERSDGTESLKKNDLLNAAHCQYGGGQLFSFFQSYDRMSHDEILREYGERYARMSPEERARQSEERANHRPHLRQQDIVAHRSCVCMLFLPKSNCGWLLRSFVLATLAASSWPSAISPEGVSSASRP